MRPTESGGGAFWAASTGGDSANGETIGGSSAADAIYGDLRRARGEACPGKCVSPSTS
jgi:hypothetical protein